MSIAGDVITAEITNATLGGSSGSINRALYSTASKVPSALLNAVVAPATISTRGIYTVGFPAKAQTPELETSLFPQGDGIATITVLDTGIVTLAGTLADGTAITASSNLVAGNVCPIFVQLNTPGSMTVRGGSFGGILTFDATQANSDVSGVDLRWFRPAVTAPTTPNPVMDLYTAGWPTGIKVDAVGALYDATLTLQSSLGAGAPATAAAGNTDLLFDNVRYKSSPTGSATVYGLRSLARTPRVVNSVVTLIPSGTTSYTLTAVQATGTFSGTVAVDVGSLITDPSKPPYRGIIVQKGTNKGGYGYVISATTGDRDPQSAGVSLTAK
jgi:hypothetical protein